MSDIVTYLSDAGESQPEYTILPPTIVATTFPVRCHPSNGVFFDFECDLAASKVHFFFGSKTVTSATEPGQANRGREDRNSEPDRR